MNYVEEKLLNLKNFSMMAKDEFILIKEMGETAIKEKNVFLGLQCTESSKHLRISSRKSSWKVYMQSNQRYNSNSHLLGTCYGPSSGLTLLQTISNLILKRIQ